MAYTANTEDRATPAAPTTAAARSGATENASSPSKASCASRLNVYFGRPAQRSWRSTSTPI